MGALAPCERADTTERLRTQNASLKTAAEARDAAREAALLHDLRRRMAIGALTDLVARAEVGILTAFPGRRDLVRAILAPPTNRSRPTEPERIETSETDADVPEA